MKGLFILTPGIECDINSSTEHYSVFATQNKNAPDEIQETYEVFSHPLVGGALFFQHHMMVYCPDAKKHIPLSREAIRKNVNNIRSVNTIRAEQGEAPIFCAFDAEPAPVQARRYVHNPPAWPQDAIAQADCLYQHVRDGTFASFIEEVIDTQGYYPMLPDQQTVGKLAQSDYDRAEAVAHAMGTITGRVMGSLGINVLFAPVCDLAAQAFPERCFSSDKQITTGLSFAWCRGAMAQPGIDKICLKHAPGHGVEINRGHADKQDTHNTQCVTYDTLAVVDEHMSVFTKVANQLIALGYKAESIMVMTNHITYAEIDLSAPVSASEKAIHYLRSHLPKGVPLVADCINMAGFADDNNGFKKRLVTCRQLHAGGVIATTHYVKQMGRKELLAFAMQHDAVSVDN